ncbi:MAG: hypothetical protein ACRDOA_03030 [Streptosporangiaceae bacterium]
MIAEEHMSPERVAAVIGHRLATSDDEVRGFWFQVRGSRHSYAESLREHLAGQAAVVLVVSGHGFESANALLDDLVALIAGHRELCEKALSAHPNAPAIGVVCLARNTLQVPVAGSPVRFPDWFPRIGGRTVMISIDDVTWTGEAALSCSEANVPALCAALFDLEGAMLIRLATARGTAWDAVGPLWEQLRRQDKFDRFLTSAADYRRSIRRKEDYRPEVKDGRSVVARIWQKVEATGPDQLGGLTGALAKALLLPDTLGIPWYRPMPSVLARPGVWRRTEMEEFAHSLIVTVATSMRFITASHHSARVLVPVPLIRSMSDDLREGLASASSVITIVDPVSWPRAGSGPERPTD